MRMEARKCEQCGGALKYQRVQRVWVCPFCDCRYEETPEEKAARVPRKEELNDAVFLVEKDLSNIMKKSGGGGCIKTIIRCMNTFATAKEVEDYMLTKLTFSDDISVKNVREEHIENAMPMIRPVMDPDERVIVYGNKGIFSKGKEYFVVTDKRCIFVNKKKVKAVLHTDIDALTIADCGNCVINGDYDKNIISLDGNGRFQGALLAMITMLSFEADSDRDRIRID